MCLKNIAGVSIITESSIITISLDGYIRLTFEELQHISLEHLISGIDEAIPVLLQEGAICAEITGYTEWVSTIKPPISIGWDWRCPSSPLRGTHYKRASEPRSNLMLVDAQQLDLGPAKTAALIATVVDTLAWQNLVQDYISSRYAS